MGSDVRNTKQLKMDLEVGEIPFKEYPRPQLYRDSAWMCLNGVWDCGVKVPFPLESVLSGFSLTPEYDGKIPEEYDYHTTFEYHPYRYHDREDNDPCRVMLHFGAVDQICDVYVDDVPVGHHEGGYLPFSFDITDILKKEGSHKLKVHVIDRLDITLPYGKQSKIPGGMWYTPVSGIWQTVWLEEVPEKHIKGLDLMPFPNGIRVVVNDDIKDFTEYTVEIFEPVTGFNPASVLAKPVNMTKLPDPETEGQPAPVDQAADPQIGDPKSKELKLLYKATILRNKKFIEITDPHMWSPDTPYLYGIRVSSRTDSVSSYFAIRTVSIEKINRHKRFFLNDKPIFFHGVLDQGYYPEGIFLPNNEKGYANDVAYMKELGFNTLRKHIKIEPPAFYVECDVQGMIVWQDMVNNSDYNFWRDTIFPTFGIKAKTDLLTHLNHECRRIFKNHMLDTVRYLHNFPCICYYTIFNEGWGQFDSDSLYQEVKSLDPTRIVDSTSGWFRQFRSDVVSKHVYFRKIAKIHHIRPVVISEFGGYNFTEKDHCFNPDKEFGYKSFKDREDFEEAILKLYREQLIPYISVGCCASIYTQLSDVEDETNGFYTYDRCVCKVDKEKMRGLASEIFTEFERCI
ncbi:MAG: hypothetical protein K6G42_04320 [Lachnospiraceae bacterium]|nr:hypothetical protein [Lachnospiraceae bacterium]